MKRKMELNRLVWFPQIRIGTTMSKDNNEDACFEALLQSLDASTSESDLMRLVASCNGRLSRFWQVLTLLLENRSLESFLSFLVLCLQNASKEQLFTLVTSLHHCGILALIASSGSNVAASILNKVIEELLWAEGLLVAKARFPSTISFQHLASIELMLGEMQKPMSKDTAMFICALLCSMELEQPVIFQENRSKIVSAVNSIIVVSSMKANASSRWVWPALCILHRFNAFEKARKLPFCEDLPLHVQNWPSMVYPTQFGTESMHLLAKDIVLGKTWINATKESAEALVRQFLEISCFEMVAALELSHLEVILTPSSWLTVILQSQSLEAVNLLVILAAKEVPFDWKLSLESSNSCWKFRTSQFTLATFLHGTCNFKARELQKWLFEPENDLERCAAVSFALRIADVSTSSKLLHFAALSSLFQSTILTEKLLICEEEARGWTSFCARATRDNKRKSSGSCNKTIDIKTFLQHSVMIPENITWPSST